MNSSALIQQGTASDRKSPIRQGKGTVERVKDGGFCVGCGACAAVPTSKVSMRLDSEARYVPIVADQSPAEQIVAAVCPFSGEGPDEDELGLPYAQGARHSNELGWYRALYAGHAVTDGHRERGSSGGLTTWLLDELFDRQLIDAVIHVRDSAGSGEPHFSFGISKDRHELRHGAKTRYYPVEMSQVVNQIREVPGRYAFVGVPCFVKAIKRLSIVDPVIGARVSFTLSLFCGHLKSGRFGESLAWQIGVRPDRIETQDFRHKLLDRPASHYGYAVRARGSSVDQVAPMRGLAGYDWGMGVFRLAACDYCDDVVGEVSDVSFGDAWLPAYVNDSAGTNLVIVRHPALNAIFEECAGAGAIQLQEISLEDVVKSQEPSFRHRRGGLAYRLWLKDRAGVWRPRKRVQAETNHLSLVQKAIFRYRRFMSSSSHRVYGWARKVGSVRLYTTFVASIGRVNQVLTRMSRRRFFNRI